jgi:hypothetical protein
LELAFCESDGKSSKIVQDEEPFQLLIGTVKRLFGILQKPTFLKNGLLLFARSGAWAPGTIEKFKTRPVFRETDRNFKKPVVFSRKPS